MNKLYEKNHIIIRVAMRSEGNNAQRQEVTWWASRMNDFPFLLSSPSCCSSFLPEGNVRHRDHDVKALH